MSKLGKDIFSNYGIKHTYTGIIKTKNSEYHYKDGLRHREDGPALIKEKGHFWFLDGKEYSFEQYWEIQKDTEYKEKIISYMLSSK